MEVVILAGGRGTRLGALGDHRPKALMPVGGVPFAGLQLHWLAQQGVERVVYSIGYLGDQIREFVGNGAAWGIEASYVDEHDRLLGTGGALRLALDENQLPERFLVLYGDSFLQIDLVDLWRSHLESALPATMAVYRNAGQYDASNVAFEGGAVIRYDKSRPPEFSDRMQHIDYGVSVLDRDLVAGECDPGVVADLADVQRRLSQAGLLGGYEVYERFYEIGTPEGLAELDRFLARQRTET